MSWLLSSCRGLIARGCLQATTESQIYPQVASGFADNNAYLRELTLKSMLVLAPKLSQKTINQSLLKHLAKLQVGLWRGAPACCCQKRACPPPPETPALLRHRHPLLNCR